jgi:hypothetical protein
VKYDGIMKKAYFLMIICVFIITLASVKDALCYPPAGSDAMDPTTATIEIEIIGMFTETLEVKGPTTVGRSSPYDPGDGRWIINTEIVSMSLTGTSSHIGPITIIESPSKASNGAIQQLSPGEDFPADSFFDVFVEIQTMLPPPLSTLHNDDLVLMSTTIYGIPPWGSIYTSSLPEPIPLKDEQDNIIGFIKHVSHKIGTGPTPIGPVGGFSVPIGDNSVPVDNSGLLALYIRLASTIIAATVATSIYIKHVKHRKTENT